MIRLGETPAQSVPASPSSACYLPHFPSRHIAVNLCCGEYFAKYIKWGTAHLNKPQIARAVTSSCKLAHKCAGAGVVLAFFRVVEKTSLLKLSLSAVKIMKNLVSARGIPYFSYL